MDRSSPFALSPDQKLFIFGPDGATNFMAGVGIPAPQLAVSAVPRC